MPEPEILTTTVGSYPVPDWLAALPSEQARVDATRVVFDLQRQAGIDLPTDGELYRFDVNHPDTNGMIDYFLRPMSGIRSVVGRSDHEAFAQQRHMQFRRKAAGVVEGPIGEGGLNLLADCELAAGVAGGPFKFTVTSPYMLARTLLDRHYKGFEDAADGDRGYAGAPGGGSAVRLPAGGRSQYSGQCRRRRDCRGRHQSRAVRVRGPARGASLLRQLRRPDGAEGDLERALVAFLNALQVDHLVLEMAHRPEEDLAAMKDVDARIRLGIGVVDVKVNHVETAEEIARRLRARRADPRTGTRRLDSPGLRLLDAQTLGGRPQDRSAGEGAGSVPGARMIGYRDPATGAQVWQVTDGPAISHPTYFLQSSFFPGGRSMFFTSYRSGSAQVWTASLETGRDAPDHQRAGDPSVQRGAASRAAISWW